MTKLRAVALHGAFFQLWRGRLTEISAVPGQSSESLDAGGSEREVARIDTDAYYDPPHQPDAVWSPDSKWIAYSKVLDSHMRAVFVYSIAEAKSFQLTDGMSDAISPAFDTGGKYLYFLASTITDPGRAGLR